MIRIYPRDVVVGDEILIRADSNGGYFTDAGTVARGQHGRQYVTVTLVESNGQWPLVMAEVDGRLQNLAGAANSKLIVRRRPRSALDADR